MACTWPAGYEEKGALGRRRVVCICLGHGIYFLLSIIERVKRA